MEDYPSNSFKSKTETKKEPEKQIEKVVSGTVKRRQKNEARKLADIFLPEDMTSIKSYILFDVIIPKVKDVLHDIGAEAWDSIWGISKRSGGSSNASRISYQRYYDSKKAANTTRDYNRDSASPRMTYSYDDIVFTYDEYDNPKGEAEFVISRMDELIDTYGTVSVADFYELCGVTGSYTDNKYGWNDIRSAKAVRIREGYVIKMPRAVPLD